MKKIEIARSFSMTKQVKQYEPIQVFASYKTEIEEGEDEEKISQELYLKAKADVERAIAQYTAPETTEQELSVVEANLKVTTDELKTLQRYPKDNVAKIAEKKFEISLYKGLIKDLKVGK